MIVTFTNRCKVWAVISLAAVGCLFAFGQARPTPLPEDVFQALRRNVTGRAF